MNEIIYHKGFDRDIWCESRYIDNIINHLNENINYYSIVITFSLNDLPKTKNKTIIIIIGDEQFRLFSDYNDIDISQTLKNQNIIAIFRIFNDINSFDEKYIFPIPPGYNWTMHDDQTKKMVKMYPEKKISKRKYDIFYSGQNLSWRQPLVDSLNLLSDKFNILCNVNKSFRIGIEIDDYYKILGETKIALVPDGTSIDTYRYVESFGSGCIVITTPKDDLWYYKDSPFFLINSWHDLNENLINHILSLNIDEIYENNLKYYKAKLSEEAVANYMIKKLCI